MSRPRTIALLLLAAALAAAGCGDDDRGDVKVESGTDTAGKTGTATTGTQTTPTVRAGRTIRVVETEFELDPQNATIAKTGIVSFRVRNAGKITHALEVEGPNGEQETEGIEPGGSASLKVDFGTAGRFEWYCPIGDHKERGMKGVITVGRSSRATDDRGGERTTTGEDDKGGGSGSSGRGSRDSEDEVPEGVGGGTSPY